MEIVGKKWSRFVDLVDKKFDCHPAQKCGGDLRLFRIGRVPVHCDGIL